MRIDEVEGEHMLIEDLQRSDLVTVSLYCTNVPVIPVSTKKSKFIMSELSNLHQISTSWTRAELAHTFSGI